MNDLRFKVNGDGAFELRDGSTYRLGEDPFRNIPREALIEDKKGKYFRQWREEITSSDDIWSEIIDAARVPGLTSAPKLQPIQTRLIMLATGMRAPIGIKVYGSDLATIENVGLELEKVLQEVPSVERSSVFADRIVGKPYLELDIDRREIARYGLTMKDVQNTIEVAIGGVKQTTTVEGRERFPVRVRYARELRDSPSAIGGIYIPTLGPANPSARTREDHLPPRAQVIKSEDTFLVGYVIFDKKAGIAEVDVVEEAQRFIDARIDSGDLVIPPGVKYKFTGNYENQLRATKRLAIVVPICLLVIFLILYFQFGDVQTSSMVFSGIFVAFSGGFLMIWLYSQPWFLNFAVAGIDMRVLFQIHPINLSVAVWVGFIALFGIATDDGVIMGTYMMQVFKKEKPQNVEAVRAAVLHAGSMRVRPAMMTAAVAVIALLPVLTSQGKGADIMVPMAIPTFGGMLIQVMTMFVVPVLYSLWQELKIKHIPREDS